MGSAYASQSANFTPEAAATATMAPLVGVTNSGSPAPYWNESTVTWREKPIKSEIGTSSGIVSTAWPLTLGTGYCSTTSPPIFASAQSVTGRGCSGATSAATISSTLLP